MMKCLCVGVRGGGVVKTSKSTHIWRLLTTRPASPHLASGIRSSGVWHLLNRKPDIGDLPAILQVQALIIRLMRELGIIERPGIDI